MDELAGDQLHMMWSIISVFLLASSACAKQKYHQRNLDTHNYYVLHHDPAYASLADVVDFFGLEIVEPFRGLDDIWLARTVAYPMKKIGIRTRKGDENHSEDDPVIDLSRRVWDRTLLTRRGENLSLALKHLSRERPRKRTHRTPSPRRAPMVKEPPTVSRRLSGRKTVSDPLFPRQWSLQNQDDPTNSLNVVPVWENGITGKGIVVAIVADGIFYNHEDLKDNFAKNCSFDFLGNTEVPRRPDARDDYGTAIAGVIAAANNDVCGVGIAYDAKVASLRIMGTDNGYRVRDVDESRVFLHDLETQAISIYVIGYSVEERDGPTYVTQQAILKGIEEGRGKKGNIYVLQTGDAKAGEEGDECNYNGYVNSIYTVAVGAVNYQGDYMRYSVPCSAVMAATYSNDKNGDDNKHAIISLGTDSLDHCKDDVGGVSAAAPAAAGIFALALETNKELTWRDMQYLCVETAQPVKSDGVTWDQLPSGRLYSNEVGFGVLSAQAFVEAATRWKTVNPQVRMVPVPFVQFDDGAMTRDKKFSGGTRLTPEGVSRTVTITKEAAEDNNFDTIEHVQVKVWIRHSKLANVQVSLKSPNGVISKLGVARPYTIEATSLPGWTFMSLKHWGEEPAGKWELTVNERQRPGKETGTGEVIGFTITFWGCARENKSAKPFELIDDGNVFPPKKRGASD